MIVLNSASMLKQALPQPLLQHYKFMYTWFDNNDTGHKATEAVKKFCAEQSPLQHTAMNNPYAEYEDVNHWLIHLIT